MKFLPTFALGLLLTRIRPSLIEIKWSLGRIRTIEAECNHQESSLESAKPHDPSGRRYAN